MGTRFLTNAQKEKVRARGYALPEEADAIRAEEAEAQATRGELPAWHPETVAVRYSTAIGNMPPDAAEAFAVVLRRIGHYLDAGKSLNRALAMVAEDLEHDGQNATCAECAHTQPYTPEKNKDGDTIKPHCRVCTRRTMEPDALPDNPPEHSEEAPPAGKPAPTQPLPVK